MDALNQDPDLSIAQKAIKNFKNAGLMKEKAGEVFKAGKYAEAIEMFDQCLAFDTLNLGFNSIINLNKSIALGKLNKNDESLKCLNLSLTMNPNYAKALVKRAEINSNLKYYDEAVVDLSKAQEIDSTGNDVGRKLKEAQANVKKSKKNKSYYEILGISKTATAEEIKAAYKKKAREFHPDRNNETPEASEKATKSMMDVNEAKNILSDKNKRAAHDRGATGEDCESGAGGMGGGMGGMDPS